MANIDINSLYLATLQQRVHSHVLFVHENVPHENYHILLVITKGNLQLF